IRTGAVPSYTSLRLSGDLQRYQIQSLSRHQRYRIAVLGTAGEGNGLSRWIDVTPRAGLAAVAPEPDGRQDLAAHVARVGRLTVMPQDRRLTVYWTLARGFADRVVLEVSRAGQAWHRMELEPEVASISLDRSRGVPVSNGSVYGVKVGVSFAGVMYALSAEVVATPAPQGNERRANASHPQENLIYPTLSVSPELRVFPEDDGVLPGAESRPLELVCCHCRQEVRWHEYRLRCDRCNAEFIPNGRGDFLEVARLRFGTCRCCLPRKILVQKGDSTSLICVHSGKEHIPMPDRSGNGASSRTYQLIEDLPYGLCQCCRPRRPLVQESGGIVCGKSKERHRNERGRYVLVPTEPVFDAKAIDDLLDAGLAEICSTGVSRGTAKAKRR
ncbi:MAG: hypothetical protein HY815_29250, partial [Candidatus Riflebacteria bacterium]|nr:hypothetical protein [Candidatus Riflebacteria bacterium]